MQEMLRVRDWSLGQENPLKKGMATYSSILAWRIPWTEESGGLQSMGSQRVGHNWSDWTPTHALHSEMIPNTTKGCISHEKPFKVVHPKFLFSALSSPYLFLHPCLPSLNFAGSHLPIPMARNPPSSPYTEYCSLGHFLQIFAYIPITFLK